MSWSIRFGNPLMVMSYNCFFGSPALDFRYKERDRKANSLTHKQCMKMNEKHGYIWRSYFFFEKSILRAKPSAGIRALELCKLRPRRWFDCVTPCLGPSNDLCKSNVCKRIAST